MEKTTYLSRMAIVALTLLFTALLSIAGYFLGYEQAGKKEKVSAVEMATVNLSYYQEITKKIDAGDLDAARWMLASKSEAMIAQLIKYGHLAERVEHHKFRNKVLCAYSQYRSSHSSLYQVPKYVNEEQRSAWLAGDQKHQAYIKGCCNKVCGTDPFNL